MKIVLVVLTLLATVTASAVEIKAGRFNPLKNVIELDVAYGGGCAKHVFSLKMGGCLESMPVQCGAQLVDSGAADMCEAYIQQTVEISLKDAGLTDSYFTGASLRIRGSSKDNVVNITLPRN